MGRDMSDAFGYAFSLLKADPAHQVRDPYGHAVKTIHPAIAGMMQRRGTFQPEGQRMHNAVESPEGYLQGGWRTSQRPHSDMSSEFPYFPAELDEGYATPEEHAAAGEDIFYHREPRFKPTVPGYAPDPHGSAFAKAINPSMQEDPNMGAGMRHRDNLERQKDIHTQQPNLRGPMRMGRRFQPPPVPVPQGHYRHDEGQMSPQQPTANQNRTLPPNPAQMPIGAGAPSMREAGGGPPPPFGFPRPVSQENPFVNAMHPDASLSDERVRTLADEFRIPIEKAWNHLRNR
jgi:hypothetical protein